MDQEILMPIDREYLEIIGKPIPKPAEQPDRGDWPPGCVYYRVVCSGSGPFLAECSF